MYYFALLVFEFEYLFLKQPNGDGFSRYFTNFPGSSTAVEFDCYLLLSLVVPFDDVFVALGRCGRWQHLPCWDSWSMVRCIQGRYICEHWRPLHVCDHHRHNRNGYYYRSKLLVWHWGLLYFMARLSHVSIYGPLAVTTCNYADLASATPKHRAENEDVVVVNGSLSTNANLTWGQSEMMGILLFGRIRARIA